MIVGVCNTKDSSWGKSVFNCLKNGVVSSGDDVIPIESHKDIYKLELCDTIMQVCAFNGSMPYVSFRKEIKKIKKTTQPLIIAERGFVNGDLTSSGYVSLCVDEIKRGGKFSNKKMPPDRWNKLNTELMPWKKTGDYILILGQPDFSGHLFPLKVKNVFSNYINEIKKYTKTPIVYRSHPLETNVKKGDYYISKNKKLCDDLANAKASFALTSNASVESVIGGVPLVCPDSRCMAYEMGVNSIKDIENLYFPCRKQWAYNLAYTQWNLDEIRSGEGWRYVKFNIIKKTSML